MIPLKGFTPCPWEISGKRTKKNKQKTNIEMKWLLIGPELCEKFKCMSRRYMFSAKLEPTTVKFQGESWQCEKNCCFWDNSLKTIALKGTLSWDIGGKFEKNPYFSVRHPCVFIHLRLNFKPWQNH